MNREEQLDYIIGLQDTSSNEEFIAETIVAYYEGEAKKIKEQDSERYLSDPSVEETWRELLSQLKPIKGAYHSVDEVIKYLENKIKEKSSGRENT